MSEKPANLRVNRTLPILGGLAVLAVVGGVSIGRSAIAEINPAYYEPDQPGPFYADLVPNTPSGTTVPESSGAEYLQADYAYSAAPTCIDCDNYPVAYRPRHDPAVDAVAIPADPEPAVYESGNTEPPPANREWIERYTTYTVAAEPAQPAARPVQAAAPPDKNAEPGPAAAVDQERPVSL